MFIAGVEKKVDPAVARAANVSRSDEVDGGAPDESVPKTVAHKAQHESPQQEVPHSQTELHVTQQLTISILMHSREFSANVHPLLACF